MADNQLENRLAQLENELRTFKQAYAIHQHNSIDGTNTLRKNINLDVDQGVNIGYASNICSPIINLGLSTEQLAYNLSVGKDDPKLGFVNKSVNMQLSLIQQPTRGNIIGGTKPVVIPFENTSISVTSGGNTTTIVGYNFTTNELSGALIDIYNSSGTFLESQTIASNTATVITISDTWYSTVSDATFFIYVPVYLGREDIVYQRLYVQGGTGGGIRFGVGPESGGQGGFLIESGGDLYWLSNGSRVGTSTTRFDITNTAGSTYRYTYDGTGTDPGITALTAPVGTIVSIQAQNFTAANNGIFTVTGSGANYFEVTNASGVAENNKTLGTGYLVIGMTYTKLN